MNKDQDALAAEIRAEMAAQRITATEMQRRTGIKHASWRNWMVTASRPVPYPQVVAVCDVLGLPVSEIVRRAEARAESAPPPEQIADQLIATLPADAQRDIARAAEGLRPKPAEDDPPIAAGDH